MDMNVGDVVLTEEAHQADSFFFTGRELGSRPLLVLRDRKNNPGYLPPYIAVDPSDAMTSSGLVPVSALGVICDIGESARLAIDHKGEAEGTRVQPTLHCPESDSYLRPTDLAYYCPFLAALAR